MKARPIIAFLLALLISQATAIRPASAQESPRVDEEKESKLTPEEEREVRDIVARFNERLQAMNDFGQIIDEMFVKDFSERLWRAPTSQLPIGFLDENLVAHAGHDVLRRYYVALMNFYGLFFRVVEIVEYQKRQSGDDAGNYESWTMVEVLSPEIINVLLSDPIIAKLAEEIRKDDEDERTQESESRQPAENVDSAQAAGATSQADDDSTKNTRDDALIKSLWQLNGVSTTFEKANELMRKRLASMPPIPPPPSSGDTKSQQDLPEISLTTLDEGEYGYPKGTRIASVKRLPFNLTFTRIDGQLKILTVVVYVD